ncbi:sugar phosphate isomerase/epimerase family protein [Aeromicrobium fastidiosum]|uniref:Sugar phosphate isomerase/epimerase n=1 Tax=Aeromicrobium fastidiosum TaxID=52699 RepID=A0A641ASN7_9ACTN|nr:sugar phosphate isomerase/epimerase family protein [Aeromicrobium fastidiosum]KAA1380682.1 sugar phosphate isomerase/epimerase [Aeromicrobium fastidiosum]MBP2390294.1 sugar phosphate isomerase/epimerase [Aeromicrobium fastidiosum]
MRLSIISDEISQDVDVAARTASANGFDGLEIRSAYGVTPHHLRDVELDRVRTVVLGHGLAVSGFDPPALKCALPRTDAELTAVRELVVDSIRRAERLGAPFVRIFTFYRSGDPDPMLAASVAREVLSGLTQGAVPLIVETGMRTNTPTMRHVLAFLDALGDDHTGILWDPGNSVFSGWDTSPFPADYLAGRDRIRHVHVKDPDGQDSYVRLGDGDLPWPEIIAALVQDDYRGWVSLETHWRPDRILSQAERDEPCGESFSRGGVEASTVCMQVLRELVEAAS